MLDYVCENEETIEDKCTYNLVIHRNAQCFSDSKDKMVEMLETINDLKEYYLIAHDKMENGFTDLHYHIILCFTRKTKPSKVKGLFVGAHIEETGNKQASIQYLVHRTAKCKMQNKEEYRYCDICTNNLNAIEKFKQLDYNIENKENGSLCQDTGEIVAVLTDDAIAKDCNLTTTDLIKKYGRKQVKQYMPLILQLRRENNQTFIEQQMQRINDLEKRLGEMQTVVDEYYKLIDKDLPF